MLKFQFQIDKAAREGENDLAMNLVQDQREWYETFGYGTPAEREEYWRSKGERQGIRKQG